MRKAQLSMPFGSPEYNAISVPTYFINQKEKPAKNNQVYYFIFCLVLHGINFRKINRKLNKELQIKKQATKKSQKNISLYFKSYILVMFRCL